MKVQRIQEFIQSLFLKAKQLSSYDKTFLSELSEKYNKRNPDVTLTAAELQSFRNLFSKRCTKIINTADDYTFGISEINQEWILLAKNLASELDTPYLLILIPILKLPIDMDLLVLTEAFESGHLFLAADNSPRSTLELFKTLEKSEQIDVLALVNIVDLYRIRAKKGGEIGLIAESGQVYPSFWYYLLEVKIPFLQTKDSLPLEILKKLILVIDAYPVDSNLRREVEWRYFYEQIQALLESLSLYPAKDLRSFYGASILVDNKVYYLVEIILDCIFLPDDNLGRKLKAVSRWQKTHLIETLFTTAVEGNLKDLKQVLALGITIDVPNALGQYLHELPLQKPIKEFVSYCETVELFSAVASDDLIRVQQLIHAGININRVNMDRQNALHKVNDTDIADLLVQKGLELDQRDLSGNTPLHSAVERNHLAMTKYFLQKDLDVDCINELGNTPLHIAAHYNFDEIHYQAQISLLTTGAKMRRDNLKIIQCLVETGAKINSRNHFGFTPLHLAVSCCHNCLGRQNPIRKPDYKHVKDKVIILCSKGADPKLRTSSKTILVTQGYYQNRNFNIDARSTPLEILYLHGSESHNIHKRNRIKREIAEVLTGTGANPSELNTQHLTLVHACAKLGDVEGLSYFINAGIDVNFQPNSKVMSPLHQVFYWQSSERNWKVCGRSCAELLLQRGAKPDITIDWEIKLNSQSTVTSLSTLEVNALFEQNNAIQHELRLGNEDVAIESRRAILKQKLKEQGYPTLCASVSLYPDEYAQLSPFSGVCEESIEFLKNYRAGVLRESNIQLYPQ